MHLARTKYLQRQKYFEDNVSSKLISKLTQCLKYDVCSTQDFHNEGLECYGEVVCWDDQGR